MSVRDAEAEADSDAALRNPFVRIGPYATAEIAKHIHDPRDLDSFRSSSAVAKRYVDDDYDTYAYAYMARASPEVVTDVLGNILSNKAPTDADVPLRLLLLRSALSYHGYNEAQMGAISGSVDLLPKLFEDSAMMPPWRIDRDAVRRLYNDNRLEVSYLCPRISCLDGVENLTPARVIFTSYIAENLRSPLDLIKYTVTNVPIRGNMGSYMEGTIRRFNRLVRLCSSTPRALSIGPPVRGRPGNPYGLFYAIPGMAPLPIMHFRMYQNREFGYMAVEDPV